MIRLFFFFFISLLSCESVSSNIIFNIDKKEIQLTTRFDGSQLLVFGAINENNKNPSVLIEIIGPNRDLTIRKKTKVWGIWIDRDFASFNKIPSFYEIQGINLSPDYLQKIRDSKLEKHFFSNLYKPKKNTDKSEDKKYFDELVRLYKNSKNMNLFETKINIEDEKLFFSTIELPEKISPGNYSVVISLVDSKAILYDVSEKKIKISKVGIQKFLSHNAENYSVFYGILSVIIALFFGFTAAEIFRWKKL